MSEKRNLAIRSWALSEVLILIVAIFAFTFFIADNVSAQPLNPDMGFSDDGNPILGDSANTGLGTSNTGTRTRVITSGGTQTLADLWGKSTGGVRKDVFFDGKLYENTLVRQIGGADTARLPNGAYVQWGGDKVQWALKSGEIPYKAETIFGTWTGGMAYLYEGLSISLWVAGAIQLIGGIAGFDQELTNSLTYGAVAGIMTWKGILSVGPKGFGWFDKTLTSGQAGIIGIGVGALVFALTYKDTSTERITLECLPWEAPLGGKNCEVCNEDENQPCSEYRCKS
ncbi:hypothetical protein CO155_00735, partial [Candidatus Pacearchaeota archaeon CG_4_9_14_3_um_filter_35_19]